MDDGKLPLNLQKTVTVQLERYAESAIGFWFYPHHRSGCSQVWFAFLLQRGSGKAYHHEQSLTWLYYALGLKVHSTGAHIRQHRARLVPGALVPSAA
jgi:4-amino-4-deoxy-L-arabinose transferase-like glycosyltransferase